MPTIFCIGRNYAAHVREMEGRGGDGVPVVFLKPEHALNAPPHDIVLPRGAGEIHHEAEIVIRVGARGEAAALALGLDLTDRTRQQEAKAKGHPWAAAKGFETSACVGPFLPLGDLPPLDQLRFTLKVNGETRQTGDTALMLRPVAELLDSVASWFGLRAGDLVFTGTPAGVGPIQAGDTLTLDLEGVPAAKVSFTVRSAGDSAPPA